MTKREIWDIIKKNMKTKCNCCGNEKYEFVYLIEHRPLAKIGEEIGKKFIICKDCFLGEK